MPSVPSAAHPIGKMILLGKDEKGNTTATDVTGDAVAAPPKPPATPRPAPPGPELMTMTIQGADTLHRPPAAEQPSPERDTAAASLTLTEAPQAFIGLARELYDGLTAWNASLLKIAYRRTPAHAWAAYRDPLAPDRGNTAAFRIGRMTHEAILEPELFAAGYVVLPDDAPKRPTERQLSTGQDSKPGTKARTDWEDAQARQSWWERFDAQHARAEQVSAADLDLAIQLRDAVINHPGLRPALRDGIGGPYQRGLNELTLTWLDPISGHRCKCRIDALRITSQSLRIYELKSAADAGPDPFGRAVVNYDYLISGAFYADGVDHCQSAIAQALGIDERLLMGLPVEVEYVVAEKERPFLVARYQLQPDQLKIGRQQYQDGLAKVVAAEELGYWPGYDQGAVPLTLPGWFAGRAE